MDDYRAFDRQAVEISAALVSRVRPEQLRSSTPCGEWTLRDLLAHMTAQHRGFAAAARGDVPDLSVWEEVPVDDDPAGRYAAACAEVTAAFAAEGLPAREMFLPLLRGGQSFPAPMAVSFHFVDYVVHAWDVAAALGEPVGFPDELLAAVVPIAEAVPRGAARLAPGSAFAPELAVPADAPPLERVLLLLGRSPEWKPAG